MTYEDEDSEAGSEGKDIGVSECDGEGIFINLFHSSDPEGSEVEDEDETSINDLVKALVFNYLKVTAPTLSKEFEYAFSFHGTQLQLEEVITSLRKSKEILMKVENDGQDELSQGATLHRDGKGGSTEDLVKGLVFNFLRDTTPSLAKDFEEAFSFSRRTSCSSFKCSNSFSFSVNNFRMFSISLPYSGVWLPIV